MTDSSRLRYRTNRRLVPRTRYPAAGRAVGRRNCQRHRVSQSLHLQLLLTSANLIARTCPRQQRTNSYRKKLRASSSRNGTKYGNLCSSIGRGPTKKTHQQTRIPDEDGTRSEYGIIDVAPKWTLRLSYMSHRRGGGCMEVAGGFVAIVLAIRTSENLLVMKSAQSRLTQEIYSYFPGDFWQLCFFINAAKPLRQMHPISPGNGSPLFVLSVHANLTKPFQKMYRYSA